jgi:MFS family permease
LKDEGYSSGWASRVLSILLFSSLAGRVIVGYVADRFTRKNVMALFYVILALAIPLLFLHHQVRAVMGFAILFGFAMGADYMLIPLVAVDCFGLSALGKILALIIMADSLGQTFGPVMAGRIFDLRHSYDLAWLIITAAGILGAGAVFLIDSPTQHWAGKTG